MKPEGTKEIVTLAEVAMRIGRSADELSARLRYCAMHGFSCPLGFAMPPSRDGGQWAYIFPVSALSGTCGAMILLARKYRNERR